MAIPEETFSPDNLIASSYPQVRDIVKIPSGQGALLRGEVLKKTGVDTYTKIAAGAEAEAILAEDTDATAADAFGGVLLSGEVNEERINFAAGTLEEVRNALRAKSIFLKKPLPNA